MYSVEDAKDEVNLSSYPRKLLYHVAALGLLVNPNPSYTL